MNSVIIDGVEYRRVDAPRVVLGAGFPVQLHN